MTQRQPNLIYIGLPKCGSTWIFRAFEAHPEIYVTPAKETYYFDQFYSRGRDWYLKHFAGVQNESVVAEICHDYIYHADVAERIARDLGQVKILACLREPGSWLQSRYLFAKRNAHFAGTFPEFVAGAEQPLKDCQFVRLLEPYWRQFGKSAVQVTFMEDLARNNQEFASSIWSFLGVSDWQLPEDLSNPVNAAARPRSVLVARFTKWAAGWVRRNGSAQLVAWVKKRPLVHRLLYAPLRAQDRATVDQETLKHIRDEVRDEVIQLFEELGAPMPEEWAAHYAKASQRPAVTVAAGI